MNDKQYNTHTCPGHLRNRENINFVSTASAVAHFVEKSHKNQSLLAPGCLADLQELLKELTQESRKYYANPDALIH